MKNITLILLAIIMLSACEKEKTEVFKDKAGISFFYLPGSEFDSTNYSFANQLQQKVKDTIFVKMRVMGFAVNYARDIDVIALPTTTAKENVHFILPKINLPANSLTVRYPIILLNSDDLKANTYHLEVAVKENKEFVQGAVGQANVSTRSIPVYKVNFNNQLIKPDYWRYIANYFGDYSNVKYRFMIDVIGISDFSPESLGGITTYSDFLNYNVRMKNALATYNSTNTPLLDETGLEVSFPL